MKEKVTAKELADYFEVSIRTIHRDLLDLSSAGFPVVSQQGVGGGVSILPSFKYNKAAFDKKDLNILLAGIMGMAAIDNAAKIKTLLAKLQLQNEKQLLLENDIIIDFTSWNHNSTIIEKIKDIRSAISNKTLIVMRYYSGKGYSEKRIEPYKLIFKQENWYLWGYCTTKQVYMIFKLNRITEYRLTDTLFDERTDCAIPVLQSNLADNVGQEITILLDQSLEFVAIDAFGKDSITKKDDGKLLVTFQSEYEEWVISTLAGFGKKVEVISPIALREKTIEHHKMYIGITKAFLTHSQWEKYSFDQNTTPYTEQGRELYLLQCKRKKSFLLDRPPLYDIQTLTGCKEQYNFEYYMNREYAYNRDRGKCKICGEILVEITRHCHHINEKLPLDRINKVSNLAWVCITCDGYIHGDTTLESLNKKIIEKIQKYQLKLG